LLQLVLYFILSVIYNRYFHPLRDYPGPFLASTTRLPYITAYVQGTGPQFVRALHDRYGNVVRIAPDELSFRDVTAWMEIYGARSSSKASLLKDMRFYNVSRNGVPNLVVAPTDEIHKRQRRIISRAFSDAALKDQEPLLQSYVDLFLDRLDERAKTTNGRVTNILEWFHFVTFDFMTEYIFGESFSCLQNCEYHPWVRVIIDTIKAWPVISSAKYLPTLAPLIQIIALFFYRDILRRRRESFQLGLSKIRKRLARQESGHYPDFISHVHASKKIRELSLTQEELDSNSSFLVLAGSETLSTSLSGCTYYLLANQDSYTKLTNEIRQSFSSLSEISFAKLAQLPYLDAVINETFRIRPPAPLGMPRCVPSGGSIISGHYIPGGVCCP
jgi:cytochrome P450